MANMSASAEQYVQLQQQQQSSALWPHSQRPAATLPCQLSSSILYRPRRSSSSSRWTWTRGIC